MKVLHSRPANILDWSILRLVYFVNKDVYIGRVNQFDTCAAVSKIASRSNITAVIKLLTTKKEKDTQSCAISGPVSGGHWQVLWLLSREDRKGAMGCIHTDGRGLARGRARRNSKERL